MKRFLPFILTVFLAMPVHGENRTDAPSWKFEIKGRMSFHSLGEDYGFKCDYLRIRVTGDLGGGFRFLFRQRLNKPLTDGDYLSATDYLNVSWRRGDWEILGGKTCLACGGFDYRASSADIYIRPEYFKGLGGMYNYALQATRFWGGESLCLQFGSSIYSIGFTPLLGASALLRGRCGPWEHSWSANYFEREKGTGNFYVCLGNRFHLPAGGALDAGIVHRMDVQAPSFMRDFSMVVKLRQPLVRCLNLVVKGTWDYKEAGVQDPMLPDGTNLWQAGGGLEFFPVRDSAAVRLHGIYYRRSDGTNCVLAGVCFTFAR